MSASSRTATMLLLMAALAGGSPAKLVAQDQSVWSRAVPATPAGRQFSAWLEAFNSGDAAKVDEFFRREALAPDRAPGSSASLRGVTGGFVPVRVEAASDERVVVLLEERDWGGLYTRLTMDVEPQAGGKVKALQLQRVPAP